MRKDKQGRNAAATANRKSTHFSLAARGRSIGYALNGLGYLLRNEPNARIHLACSTSVALAGWWVGLSTADWRWITLAVALVWFTEAINTALEFVCDVVSPDHHPLVEKAKDIAAGAVLVGASAAAVIGGLTFWPYLLH